jgi:hypothetical protein
LPDGGGGELGNAGTITCVGSGGKRDAGCGRRPLRHLLRLRHRRNKERDRDSNDQEKKGTNEEKGVAADRNRDLIFRRGRKWIMFTLMALIALIALMDIGMLVVFWWVHR